MRGVKHSVPNLLFQEIIESYIVYARTHIHAHSETGYITEMDRVYTHTNKDDIVIPLFQVRRTVSKC